MFILFPENIKTRNVGGWLRLENLEDRQGNVVYIKFPHHREVPAYIADTIRRTASALCYHAYNAYLDDALVGTTEY